VFAAIPVTSYSLTFPYRKIEEWGFDDGFGPMPDPAEELSNFTKSGRVVVLKHMFTLDDLAKDASLLLDLKEDVREECSSLGEVTNVVLYDVSDRFKLKRNTLDPNGIAARGRWCNDSEIQRSYISTSLYSGAYCSCINISVLTKEVENEWPLLRWTPYLC
jgi:HIV Tat-specific factor 1